MGLHSSGEMYLETIHVLLNNNETVRALDVAEHMGFSKPSVSRALKLLKNDGYIDIDVNGHITFTSLGQEVAIKIFERHNILTRALELLGVDKATAADDACKIEHHISDKSVESIKKFLEQM